MEEVLRKQLFEGNKHILPLFPNKDRISGYLENKLYHNYAVKKTDAVCERHFHPSCFKSQDKKIKRLKADAVPTINLDHTAGTGFPLKDAHFSKLKNIPYLHSDDRKSKKQKISTSNI